MTIPFDPSQFEKSRILVIGDMMLDQYIWGQVQRISPEAPVPVLHIRKRSEVPGGSGNVVSNLIGLGCSVTCIAMRGKDENGDRLSRLLENPRILGHILIDPDRPTVTKTRVVSQGQQLLRLDEEDTAPAKDCMGDEIISLTKESLPECDAVVLSDYGKGLLRSKRLVQTLIELSKEHNVPVIVDPKGKDWERYSGSTCITPNTKELEAVYDGAIAGKEDLLRAMRSILIKYNLCWVLATRGSLGMCLISRNDEPLFIPALAREVYDVSGAGDTAIATLSIAVGSGHSFPDAAKLANLAAGIVVGKIGTQPIHILELKAAFETSGVDEKLQGFTHKLASLSSAVTQVEAWKARREKIVFTNGCFDLLHPGHIHLLNHAKTLGDRLVVAINSDASVKRLKGATRHILHERDRACMLASLDCVDLVVVFETDTPEHLLRSLKPEILTKGADYSPEAVVGREIVESYGGLVRLIPILQGYSTTAITKRMIESRFLASNL